MTGLMNRLSQFCAALVNAAERLEPAALLFARLLVARMFWLSGLGKVETVTLGPLRFPTPEMQSSTYFLFAEEFFPNLPEAAARLMAVFAASGELTLPLMLVFGLLTRAGALGLLLMTAVIQIFVFPGEWWPVHAWWAAVLLIIFVRGPGLFSLDFLLGLERRRKV